MKRTLEVRPAEGGDDSKLFARDLLTAYTKLCPKLGWKHRIVGPLSVEIEGRDLSALDHEAGGHRIQRIPPTERSGRVHTSTVTVAIIDGAAPTEISFSDDDFTVQWFSGTGKGGQYRNKHQNCCRLIHKPTGIIQTGMNARDRKGNLRAAREAIEATLRNLSANSQHAQINSTRKQQVGSGMRGDKRRTYRFRDDVVQDDITGKQARCSDVMRGGFDKLWRW